MPLYINSGGRRGQLVPLGNAGVEVVVVEGLIFEVSDPPDAVDFFVDTSPESIVFEVDDCAGQVNAFAINSFAASVGVLEVGADAVAPGFVASYNNTPTSADLTNDDNAESKNVVATPTVFTSDATYTESANNAAVQFTLTADDGTGPVAANASIAWRPRVFYGVGVDGLSSEADIEGLANQPLRSGLAITFGITAGATDHIYYAAPSSYGTPTFQVGAFPGGFILESAAVSVTNGTSNPVAQNYDLWKSVNPNLGSVTVQVT